MDNIHTLNPVIHVPVRLGILTVLSKFDSCGFTTIRDTLRVSDGNLSSHLKKLEAIKYVKVEKSFINNKQHSAYEITLLGGKELRKYLLGLKAILAEHDLE